MPPPHIAKGKERRTMGIQRRPPDAPNNDDRLDFRPDRRWVYSLLILVALLTAAVIVSIFLMQLATGVH